MDERVKKAVDKYLKIKGYAGFDEEINGFMVYEDRGTTVFVRALWDEEVFKSFEPEDLRSEFEAAIAQWAAEYGGDDDVDLRCDEVSFLIINEGRAVLRHLVNVFG